MDADWRATRITAGLKDTAWAQLGTSGSGNHFVEFGALTVTDAAVGLEPGQYLALLSHSGSRGSGAQIAQHFSKVARQAHPELPQALSHLAWLDLASEAGQEYWAAMELMGELRRGQPRADPPARGARARRRRAPRHREPPQLRVAGTARAARRPRAEVIVHRKGATPAGAGMLGIIPGSMATPGYVVRGKGSAASLQLRVARRRPAHEPHRGEEDASTGPDAQRFLRERGVTLISAGLDEVPMAYKDIDAVMAAQRDLVEPLARFEPRLVKMAPSGEPPED